MSDNVLTDIYGKNEDTPAAAKFGRGARTIAEIEEATSKQWNSVKSPRNYEGAERK